MSNEERQDLIEAKEAIEFDLYFIKYKTKKAEEEIREAETKIIQLQIKLKKARAEEARAKKYYQEILNDLKEATQDEN